MKPTDIALSFGRHQLTLNLKPLNEKQVKAKGHTYLMIQSLIVPLFIDLIDNIWKWIYWVRDGFFIHSPFLGMQKSWN